MVVVLVEKSKDDDQKRRKNKVRAIIQPGKGWGEMMILKEKQNELNFQDKGVVRASAHF